MPPASISREVLVDQILLEQFLRDLEEGTQLWVRCHLPRSVEEALRIAEAFPTTEIEPSKEWVNRNERGK